MKTFFTLPFLLLFSLLATAQDFQLYYANNVSDVNDFNAITMG